MTELLTAAQMRAIEQAAIASGEVTGLELMERAGQGVVEAVFEEWPELAAEAHRAVVLCGPGNNGGDGFVVARLLKDAGWEVEVFLYGDADKLPPDARVNYERWGEMGGVNAPAIDGGFSLSMAPEILVDALFGIGLNRPFDFGTEFRPCFATFEDPGLTAGARVVAVDTPSGLCLDSGRRIGPSLFAHLTVTFHRYKIGHLLDVAISLMDRVVVADIGLPPLGVGQHGIVFDDVIWEATSLERLRGWQESTLPKNAIEWNGIANHKYSHGHALILSGGVGKSGAGRLAARAALRVGAGAVTLGCPPAALIENAAQLNAVMLSKIRDADGLYDVLEDDRINALCMGPGMGVSDESRGLVEVGLQSGRGLVLDADALTLIARDAQLFGMLHEKCVLTPHGGEFARLFPDLAEKLAAPATIGPAYSKVDAARDAAKRAGCVVLFKGPDTVITDPSGRCSINASVYERGAPWLATAGSGDVLAGFITGLLARGFAPMRAAETGAWLHTECALSFGPGLIAEDLPEELPKVFRTLGI